MTGIILVLSVCIKLSRSASITNTIPCGSTSCDNVGYESCVRPPEVRTEADSLCYSCEELTRYGDPCDPTNTRQGCVLYCIDKAVESQNRTWQRLVLEKDNAISLLRKNATEQVNKLEDANKLTQVYLALFVATICITILAVVLYVYCKKGDYKSVDTSESCSTDSTANSKTVSESEGPKSNQDPNSSCSVEETRITNSETHEVECRDPRLNNVPPQQDDSGEMCTGSSLTQSKNETTEAF